MLNAQELALLKTICRRLEMRDGEVELKNVFGEDVTADVRARTQAWRQTWILAPLAALIASQEEKQAKAAVARAKRQAALTARTQAIFARIKGPEGEEEK